MADAAFAMLDVREEAGMLDGTMEERVILELMRFELDAAEALRALAPVRGPAEVEASLALAAATRETMRAALVYNDYAAVEAPLAAACARLGLVLEGENRDGRRLARRAAQALIEVADENSRREQGFYMETGLIGLAQRRHGNPEPASVIMPLPTLPIRASLPRPVLAAHHAARPATAHPPPHAALNRAALDRAALDRAAPGMSSPPGHGHTIAALMPDGLAEVHRAGTAAASAVPEAAVPSAGPMTSSSRAVSPPTVPDSADAQTSSIFAARVVAELDAERARNAALGIRPTAERMHMGRAFDAYISDMIVEKGKSWEKNSAPNLRSSKVLFIEINGDFWTDQVDELHFAMMRNLLRAVPKDHHKSPAQKPILEEIAELDEKEAMEMQRREAELRAAGADRGTRETELKKLRRSRLSVSTAYRHQQDLQRFARWGVARGLFPRNFMEGLMWSKRTIAALQREEKDNRRLPWGDKAQALFGSRIFVQPLDDPGDALFWAPLISRLGGLREEEALQLKVGDVDTIDGVHVFRIQQGEGQFLKNEAARRIVPIHQALIALGLLALVEQRRREGQEWLFPKVERSASRGRLTGTFTKTFTRYRLEIGVYDPNRDFHSLRQDFNVSLTDADVDLPMRKLLMGHTVTDVTEVNYNRRGRGIHQLAEYINRMPFDISGIRASFAWATRTITTPRLALVTG